MVLLDCQWNQMEGLLNLTLQGMWREAEDWCTNLGDFHIFGNFVFPALETAICLGDRKIPLLHEIAGKKC